MSFSAVKIHAKDNVATVLRDISAGEVISYYDGTGSAEVTAAENIPIYHKIALLGLKQGDTIYKYGESLGLLTSDVPLGGWISHKNLASQPRDYETEY